MTSGDTQSKNPLPTFKVPRPSGPLGCLPGCSYAIILFGLVLFITNLKPQGNAVASIDDKNKLLVAVVAMVGGLLLVGVWLVAETLLKIWQELRDFRWDLHMREKQPEIREPTASAAVPLQPSPLTPTGFAQDPIIPDS